jgi:serralysin
LANVLYASAGDNRIDGGVGSDTVSYAYATAGVTISLATTAAQATGSSGFDTLIAIENLAGSNYNDSLAGNAAANTLNGGVGADTLDGGDGSDIYYVDHVGDLVVESNATLATGGTDTVYSYLAAYTLGANVENLRLLAAGTADATGNALNNCLYAGSGNNRIDGAGGIDTVSYLYGVGSSGVTASLAAGTATGGSGSDLLVAIENLTGSKYADTLAGDGNANRLEGGNGNDTLSGGSGIDTLSGGLGADVFRFDAQPDAATNRDTIADFNVVDDTIELENAVFTSLLNPGTLAAGSFRSGSGASSALDADDYLVYDSSSGALYYDASGNAGVGPVQIATLAAGLALSSLDFVVT